MENFECLWFDCENCRTNTSDEQTACEEECANFLRPLYCYEKDVLTKLIKDGLASAHKEICLMRKSHITYLRKFLRSLPEGFVTLDASRSWICYWICHALYLMQSEATDLYEQIIQTLSHFQNKTGGFGGGPRQLSQGAPNYAAVLTLCTIGTKEAYSTINRAAMYNYFINMKQPCGGFSIHTDGEVDSRGTYTFIAIARILNILTPELIAGTAEYLLSCQTYEGGFGGEPGNEAHGGYNFCAMAALLILKKLHLCNMPALEHWLVHRQVKLEGGFQGRTNKLVDSCYSFWQGAGLAILDIVQHGGDDLYDLEKYLELESSSIDIDSTNDENTVLDITNDIANRIHIVHDTTGSLPFNQLALQRYILHCGQNLEGGMRDKPGKSRDFYHSCYSLSGLSISQRAITTDVQYYDTSTAANDDNVEMLEDLEAEDTLESKVNKYTKAALRNEKYDGAQVYGDPGNLLEPTSAVFNIGLMKLKSALDYFGQLPNTHEQLLSEYHNRTEIH